MNRAFSRRRDRLLTYQTMRQGRVSAFRPAACPQCGAESSLGEWNQNLQVCPKCGFHGPIGAYYRLAGILDPGAFQELQEKLSPAAPWPSPATPPSWRRWRKRPVYATRRWPHWAR